MLCCGTFSSSKSAGTDRMPRLNRLFLGLTVISFLCLITFVLNAHKLSISDVPPSFSQNSFRRLQNFDRSVHSRDYTEHSNDTNSAPNTRPIETPPKRVLLVSYIRAGTTFTGDLLQLSPHVFYMYEPLWYINDVDLKQPSTKLRALVNYKMKHLPDPPDPLDYLHHLMSCNLTTHRLDFLIPINKSRSFYDFWACQGGVPEAGRRRRPSQDCDRQLARRCEQTPVVVAKVVRLMMWEVDALLTSDPGLKVIFLIRDPRGIVASRKKAAYYVNTGTLCLRMTEDLTLSRSLDRKHAGRFLVMRYEDLASSPVPMTRKLYDFAEIPWSRDIELKIGAMTNSAKQNLVEDRFLTERRNSALTAVSWRRSLDFVIARSVAQQCRRFLADAGYKELDELTDYHDLNLPSFSSPWSISS